MPTRDGVAAQMDAGSSSSASDSAVCWLGPALNTATAPRQSLACAAHLATQHQYNRLRQHLPVGDFPATDRPRLDVYVLLYRFLETQQDDLKALDMNADVLSGLGASGGAAGPGV